MNELLLAYVVVCLCFGAAAAILQAIELSAAMTPWWVYLVLMIYVFVASAVMWPFIPVVWALGKLGLWKDRDD